MVLHTPAICPKMSGRALVVVSANPSMPSRTPADFSADMAFGHSGHAHTINSCLERSASEGDLRDHAVRLVNRRNRHCLC